MIRILCYGDSNTWGYIPGTGKRFDESTRWTKRLQTLLGDEFEIIEEGLRGRNAGHDFEFYPRGNLNGALTFPQSILTHDPIDFVIIMLGTNDLDERFNCDAKNCAKIIEEKYINYLRKDLVNLLYKVPKIIIIAPNIMGKAATKLKDYGVVQKSQKLNTEYEKIAKKNNCIFVSNENLISGIDGIHLNSESHKYLAGKLASIIKTNLF